MIDKKFWRKHGQNIVNKYRKHIFDPAGGGASAKTVHGKEYPATYSTNYGRAKRNKTLPRRNARFANSNAPVLTGDLMKDFQGFDLTKKGFQFGTPTRGGVVKNLQKLRRPISTLKKPIPTKVEDYIFDLVGKELKGQINEICKKKRIIKVKL